MFDCKSSRRELFQRVATAATLALAAVGTARAEDWPVRPIRIVVGQSAGGAPDILTRIVGQRVSEILGQPVVVDLKPSGGGIIGADTVAKAPADGYTWLLATPTAITVAPYIKRRLPYDAAKDFMPVTLMGQSANVLVVGPRLKVKTTAELVAHIKAHPGQVSFASAGLGTAAHLAGELLATSIGTPMVHVPYKGAGQAMNDVAGGQVDFMLTSPLAAKVFMDAGRVTALATTGLQPDPQLPRLPLLADTVPGYQIVQWWGMVLRSGTPAPIVERIHAALLEALGDPKVKAQFIAQGVSPRTSTQGEFAEFLAAERRRYQELIKRAAIEQED
jgi:tripartite-type tricarboxylate transporter receptor subunit TctC